MIRFSALFTAIDGTNATSGKVTAIRRYLDEAPAEDAAWAVFFLTGRRLKRLVPYRAVADWTVRATGVDRWLLEECYAAVGDGAETAALILDAWPAAGDAAPLGLAVWVEQRILALRQMDVDEQEARVLEWIRPLDRAQRLVLFKLITGELRLGVSHTLVVRAVAESAGLPPTTIAARLMGEWEPTAEWFARLRSADVTDDDRSRPYPFALAAPIDHGTAPEGLLGDRALWQAEWKWDGIRAQIVRRAGDVHIWSRGEELITQRFPEIAAAAKMLPDGTVLDGEILAFASDRPLPFSALQQRIGRQHQVARKARDIPVVFMAYDLVEHDGRDMRAEPLRTRRDALTALIGPTGISGPDQPAPVQVSSLLPFDETLEPGAAVVRASPVLAAADWSALAHARAHSRDHGVEGLMLKRLDSPYGVGRKRGDWWKWKIEPFTVDAVLIYAQPGSGKRASLLTDYTFGVWDQGELVPVAKAYSGLSNDEIAELDRWIRRHTVERFGPVRHVEPVHVFELGFEAIAPSPRHRSGVAVRFPRMLRWRKDKPVADADTLDALRALLPDRRNTP